MKKIFVFLSMALLVLAGCSDEEVADGTVAVHGNSMNASFEQGSGTARLAIALDNALTWSKGDAFKLLGDNGAGRTYTLEGEGGNSSGTFVSADDTDLGTIKGAAFPVGAVTSLKDETLTMNLPSEISLEEGLCNLPMYATTSSESSVSFKHLGGVLRVDLSNIPDGTRTLYWLLQVQVERMPKK